MVNGGSKSGLITAHQQFLEEMLLDTQQSLSFARSVKEAKFLQNKISYLRQQINKANGFANNEKRKLK